MAVTRSAHRPSPLFGLFPQLLTTTLYAGLAVASSFLQLASFGAVTPSIILGHSVASRSVRLFRNRSTATRFPLANAAGSPTLGATVGKLTRRVTLARFTSRRGGVVSERSGSSGPAPVFLVLWGFPLPTRKIPTYEGFVWPRGKTSALVQSALLELLVDSTIGVKLCPCHFLEGRGRGVSMSSPVYPPAIPRSAGQRHGVLARGPLFSFNVAISLRRPSL